MNLLFLKCWQLQ